MIKLITQASLIGCALVGCSTTSTQSGPAKSVYAQRAYLGQIGLPITSDVAIIQASSEHVIWVDVGTGGRQPYQWLAPVLPLSAMVKEAMKQPAMLDRQPEPATHPAPQTATVHFVFGSPRLSETEKTKLNALTIAPGNQVEVVGHTDNVGSEAYNQTLSAHRADSVKNHLIVRGVAPAAIKTKANGKSTPIADNNTAAGRAENRRANVTVDETEETK